MGPTNSLHALAFYSEYNEGLGLICHVTILHHYISSYNIVQNFCDDASIILSTRNQQIVYAISLITIVTASYGEAIII